MNSNESDDALVSHERRRVQTRNGKVVTDRSSFMIIEKNSEESNMKVLNKALRVGVAVVLLLLTASCSPKAAPTKVDLAAVAKPEYHDPLFGTWIQQNSKPQKIILHSDWNYEAFDNSNDQQASTRGIMKVVDKQADPTGNFLYRMNMTANSPGGPMLQSLWRLSKDMERLELSSISVTSFQEQKWPQRIDPNQRSYQAYQRRR
jgi:hypothetical protein